MKVNIKGKVKKTNVLQKAGDLFLSIDQFSENFTMKLDGENDQVRTFMGSLCSIVLLTVVLAYAYQKVDVYINKRDVDIMTSVQRAFFDEDYVFDHS